MSFRWIQIRGKSHCRFQSNRNYMYGTERVRRWLTLHWLYWTDLTFRRSDLKQLKWSHVLIPTQLMVQARESVDAPGPFLPFLRPSCQRCVEGPFATECKNGKSSARDLVSGADAWRTSGGLKTALLSGMECPLGYKQAALDWE